nr:sensor histidine kinase [Pedobacter panaciterrae]
MIRFQTSTIIIHTVAWLLFMSFPLLFFSQGGNSHDNSIHGLSWPYLQFPLVYMFIFYINAYYLFPKFYVKKKYVIYTLSVLLLLAAVMIIKPFDRMMQEGKGHDRPMPPRPMAEVPMTDLKMDRRPLPPIDRPFKFDILSFFVFAMVMGMGTALSSIKELQLTEKRAILAEADRANAELSFLKAQINPHFLYNTLNNIYTLCVTGSQNAADSIMKLSNIMRYVTDEAEANFVSLQGELDCIRDFIDLQKLRLGKKVSLTYHVTGDPSGHLISPLILMTFIENVFKYGLSNHVEAPIAINIDVFQDRVVFKSQNKIFENKQNNDRLGVGIKNTTQRLDHLYPGKYQLSINDKDGAFNVNLVLFS